MSFKRPSEDLDLIVAAQRGDDRAWQDLVERYGQLVWSIGRRCGLTRDDAEDLVQSVFTILIRRLPDLDASINLGGWLVVTTKREAWRLSERTRRHQGSDVEDGHHPVDHAEPEAESFERQQAVREALATLGSRCRELLTDLFGRAEAPSYEEVARRLGLAVNSVGPTRRRCLEDLLRHLRDHAGGLFEPIS
jgi:RNA polymerase sigma factor (sigma-70 family)